MALELVRIDEITQRYRVEAPNGDEFFIRRRINAGTSDEQHVGQWGAWRWGEMGGPNHDGEPDYQHGQLTHLVAMIEAKERPLAERFDDRIREVIKDSLGNVAYIAQQERQIDGEAARQKAPLIERRNLITREIREVISKRLDLTHTALHLGAYECPTSPTGHCVYDDMEDHMHDHCLFCHDPSERK